MIELPQYVDSGVRSREACASSLPLLCAKLASFCRRLPEAVCPAGSLTTPEERLIMTYAPVVTANRRTWPFRLPPSWTLLAGLLAALAWWNCSPLVDGIPGAKEDPVGTWTTIIPSWCPGRSCTELPLVIDSALGMSCTDNLERGDYLCIQMGTATSPPNPNDAFIKVHVEAVTDHSIEFGTVPYPPAPLTNVHAFILKRGDIQSTSRDTCPQGAQYGRVNWSWDGTGTVPLKKVAVAGTPRLQLDPKGKVSINVKADALTAHTIKVSSPTVKITADGYDQHLLEWDVCNSSTVELDADSLGEHVVWHEGLDCEKGKDLGHGEKLTLSFWPSTPLSQPASVCAYYYKGCLENPTVDDCNTATCAGKGPSVQVKCQQARCVLDKMNHEAIPGKKVVTLLVSPTSVAFSQPEVPLQQATCASTTALPRNGAPDTNCQNAQVSLPPDLLMPPGFSYMVQVKGRRIIPPSLMLASSIGCSYVPGSRPASVNDSESREAAVQLGRGMRTTIHGTEFSVQGFVDSSAMVCSTLQLELSTWNLGPQDKLSIDAVNITEAVAKN